jgi:hypothetical protein
MSNSDLFRTAQQQKASRKYWRERFGSLTLGERQALVRSTTAPSDFEVQAHLYHELRLLGWHVRGEIQSTCKSARFDLVVFDHNFRPVRILEVKKRRKGKGGSAQSSRYAEFGIPVTLIDGMKAAERFLAGCTAHALPSPTHTVSSTLLDTATDIPQPAPRITVTKAMIEEGRCRKAGGFKHRQLTLLGVTVPTAPGWIDRLDGTEIDELAYHKFLKIGSAPGKGKFT